ncbi:MAG: hypothetical protein B6I38_03545 [Anaerolineaceae bacterium 4572_5.1]|nr:MAG: hypothetical protein B5M51_02750 [Anaerolinea sp. 4484_236]OQY33502.1 MAG: hypothetical protein B6I38_03545 [Anaerolineaceae bacterium 4572_5.1]
MNSYQEIKEILKTANHLEPHRKEAFLSWFCDHFSVEGVDEALSHLKILGNEAVSEHKSLIENEYKWCESQPLDRVIRISKGKKV